MKAPNRDQRPPTSPPDEAKQQQCQHRIAKAEMPDHGASTDRAADGQPGDANGQSPVEKPRRQVPDAYLGQSCVLVHLHFDWFPELEGLPG